MPQMLCVSRPVQLCCARETQRVSGRVCEIWTKGVSPEDIVVLLLTGAITVALVATALLPYVTKQPPSDERAKTIGALVAAIIAIISLYIGAKLSVTP